MIFRRVAVLLVLILGVCSLPAVVANSAVPVVRDGGTWHVAAAARIMDTQSGLGVPGPVRAGATVSLKVAGQGGIPATGIESVALTITVPDPAQAGSVTVFAAGAPIPITRNVVFAAHHAVSTLVLVPVSKDGRTSLRNNSAGAVQLSADTAGYISAGPPGPGGYAAVAPSRLAAGHVAALKAMHSKLTGRAGVPAIGVSAVALVVTVSNPGHDGFLTVRPAAQIPPGSTPGGSNVNFAKGRPAGNLVIVPVGADGFAALFNNSVAGIDLSVDVVGYVLAGTPQVGSLITPTMTRLVDSRTGFGLPSVLGANPLDPHSFDTVKVTGRGGVPGTGVAAVLISVSVTRPTHTGSLLVAHLITDSGSSANVNFQAGQGATDLVLVPVSGNGTITLLNLSEGTLHLIVDLVGYVQGPKTDPPLIWSTPTPTAAGLTRPTRLDCPTSTFCLAADNTGTSAVFNGSTWRSVGSLGLGPTVTGLSCPTTTFCLATNDVGAVATFDGAAWHAARSPGSGRFLDDVSCASATFCITFSEDAKAWRWTGSTWTGPTPMTTDDPEQDPYAPVPQAISCASATFCLAAGTRAGSWIYNGSTWRLGGAPLFDTGRDVSCPTSGFCAVFDFPYGVTTLRSGTWSDNVSLTYFGSSQDISCVDATFCVVVGNGNETGTWDGTEWTDPAFPIVVPGEPVLVSCADRHFCMSLDQDGRQLIARN